MVTVTKEWSDKRTNEERPEPEIKISAKKPSKSILGYTVTFHGDKDAGLVFDDGSDVNEVIYNGNGQIVNGAFKVPGEFATEAVSWFTDKAMTNKVDVNEDGTVQMDLSRDVDLWAKVKTFEVKGYKYVEEQKGYVNQFEKLIPKTVTSIIFTDEVKPTSASIIDVDDDGDGGVVAWTENDDTVMKISTQIQGVKVQGNTNSKSMFAYQEQLQNIDFANFDAKYITVAEGMFFDCKGLQELDISNFDVGNIERAGCMFADCKNLEILNMPNKKFSKLKSICCYNEYSVKEGKYNIIATYISIFEGCSSLTNLDLSSLDTSNVKDMSRMFDKCSGLTSLDLTPLNTANVTDMNNMFSFCSGLTNLDLTPLDTTNVTNMFYMFSACSSLTSLDLTPLNTAKVTDMGSMFSGCSGLTSLDLTTLNTSKVTSMRGMFDDCSGLANLDLNSFNTTNVTDMSNIFSGCRNLTNIDLAPLDTTNVTDMSYMFYRCYRLTNLDLTPLDTSNVTDMSCMFASCHGLTNLNLTPLDTTKVTNMYYMFGSCSGLTSLDLTPLDTTKVTDMRAMFKDCDNLTTIETSTTFKFTGTDYSLPGTWRNTAGETFTSGTFPSNVADTYTRIS